jgi:hypothetical protein
VLPKDIAGKLVIIMVYSEQSKTNKTVIVRILNKHTVGDGLTDSTFLRPFFYSDPYSL